MQFLINRPNSPSSPHHREKKLLTTLNNLTFDSHTPLTVQRNSYSLVFIPLSIPTKSYMQDRFSVGSILFLRTLYRRPALQHSLSPLRFFSDPRRSVPESSRAWGMRRSEPALKPRNKQRSNEFLGGLLPLLLRLPLRREIISPGVAQCLSGTASSDFFSALLAPCASL